ncbi:MAG: DUF1565 domain-containing protein [Anaerolineae bacterium]
MRPVEPTDGMVITADTTFKSGIYVLPHGLSIAADGITVDGNGALLIGQGRTGNRKAIRIAADQDHGIRPLDPSGRWGQPAPRPHDHAIYRNTITGNVIGIELVDAEATTLAENQFHGNVRDIA